MPTYLTHAFPFPRTLIRIFTVLHNLSDCSPEHLISPASSHAFLTCLHKVYPFIPFEAPPPSEPPAAPPSGFDVLASQGYSPVKVLEPYNPEDLSSAFTPYAYIADYAVKIEDAAEIGSVIAQYEATAGNKEDWFENLMEELVNIGGGMVEPAKDEGGITAGRITWYVVVNGDEERSFPGASDTEDDPEKDFKLEAEVLGKGKQAEEEKQP